MEENKKLIDREDVRNIVREKYGAAALTVLNGQRAACCGGNAGGGDSCCGGDVITGNLYSETQAFQSSKRPFSRLWVAEIRQRSQRSTKVRRCSI